MIEIICTNLLIILCSNNNTNNKFIRGIITNEPSWYIGKRATFTIKWRKTKQKSISQSINGRSKKRNEPIRVQNVHMQPAPSAVNCAQSNAAKKLILYLSSFVTAPYLVLRCGFLYMLFVPFLPFSSILQSFSLTGFPNWQQSGLIRQVDRGSRR